MKRRRDILLILRKGETREGTYIDCKVLKGKKDRKVAFFVKKVKGLNAVKRNRIKRLMRECYRKNIELFQGKWVIFFGKKEILNLDKEYLYIYEEMRKLNSLEVQNEKNSN